MPTSPYCHGPHCLIKAEPILVEYDDLVEPGHLRRDVPGHSGYPVEARPDPAPSKYRA